MSQWRAAFGWLQKIGKSLMLPVSVLPAAGILLGVGSAKFTWLPVSVSSVMAQAGGAVFSNLPLIFAIGVALGLTGNDGVAALASVVGFAVMLATMGVMAPLVGYEPRQIMGIPSIETGVFGGILIGAVAAILFNRYYRLQLPSYLGFFSGKRSVPIMTAFLAIVVGIVLSLVWPPIGNQINRFSHWAANGNPAAAFAIYGVVERSLIPFGLHHIWNVPFFFEVGTYLDPATGKEIHGEIYRFTAGDPTAGHLAGGYLFKMWGLPAAAFAKFRALRRFRLQAAARRAQDRRARSACADASRPARAGRCAVRAIAAVAARSRRGGALALLVSCCAWLWSRSRSRGGVGVMKGSWFAWYRPDACRLQERDW